MQPEQSTGERLPSSFVADFLDPATRSRVMARIGSKDTKPELALGAALHDAGVCG